MAATKTGGAGPLEAESQFVRREILLLAALAVAALGVFQLTRMVADREQQATIRDAAAWYGIGAHQLQAGRAAEAVSALRHATRRDRGNRAYETALARALVAAGRSDEARLALLDLRESAPDDPQISVELARLAAGREDVPEAARYYHSALYGVWALGRDDARVRLHVEFIRFLMAHNQPTAALAELLALLPNLPDKVASHVEAGQLLTSAGDNARAREQFSRALGMEPRNREALVGAGEAAFADGDYLGARRYLSDVAEPSPHVLYLRTLSALVVDSDPLAPRLALSERQRRLTVAFAQAERRIDDCTPGAVTPAAEASARLDALRREADAFEPSLGPPATVLGSPDRIETGAELVYRIELESADTCGPPAGLDEALLIIARRRGTQTR